MLLTEINITDSKILIVDDTLQNVLFLKQVIADLGKVFFAESGADALALIPKINPDLILLDIEMPDMNGWQLCKTLKQDPRFANIPIIFITGHDQQEFEQMSLELGCADFITKPFKPAICKLRVQNQLKLVMQHRMLNKGREQLQQLLKQVPVLITYWDENWQHLFSNDYSGSWFGIVNRDSDNFTINEAFPEELSETVKQHATIECSEQQFVVETVVQGETCIYKVFQSAILVDELFEGHLITIMDISDVKRAPKARYF